MVSKSITTKSVASGIFEPMGKSLALAEPMDAEGVLAAADRNWTGFVPETTVGHVHLKVADLSTSDTFYRKSWA